MSELLRVKLKPSLAAVALDPGGVFWPGQVEDWLANRRATVFKPQESPRIGTLPSEAIVYIRAPNELSTGERDLLRREWSKKTWAVRVESVEPVQGVPTHEADAKGLGLAGVGVEVSQAAGKVVSAVVTIAVVAAVVYAVVKAGGTKTWR